MQYDQYYCYNYCYNMLLLCYSIIIYQDCYNKIIYSYTLILISFLSPSTPLLILLDYFASHWSLALCIFFSSLLMSITHKTKKLNMWKIVGRGKKRRLLSSCTPFPHLKRQSRCLSLLLINNCCNNCLWIFVLDADLVDKSSLGRICLWIQSN